MNKTEIKKELYKQKPIAEFVRIRNGVAYYKTLIDLGLPFEQAIHFEIPVDDMGNADFEKEMDGKLLIRWIVDNENPILN